MRTVAPTLTSSRVIRRLLTAALLIASAASGCATSLATGGRTLAAAGPSSGAWGIASPRATATAGGATDEERAREDRGLRVVMGEVRSSGRR